MRSTAGSSSVLAPLEMESAALVAALGEQLRTTRGLGEFQRQASQPHLRARHTRTELVQNVAAYANAARHPDVSEFHDRAVTQARGPGSEAHHAIGVHAAEVELAVGGRRRLDHEAAVLASLDRQWKLPRSLPRSPGRQRAAAELHGHAGQRRSVLGGDAAAGEPKADRRRRAKLRKDSGFLGRVACRGGGALHRHQLLGGRGRRLSSRRVTCLRGSAHGVLRRRGEQPPESRKQHGKGKDKSAQDRQAGATAMQPPL
jgi:hypothetical protein